MKRLIIGIALLIVLLAGAFAAAIMTLNSIDWSEYEEPIAKAVKDATGRELRFSGALNVDISLSPGISANDVSLQNVAWGSREAMVTLEHAEIRLKLLPLVFGRIELSQLEIIGLDLLLETDRQGNGNWEFELAGADAPPAPTSEDENLLTSAVLKKAVIQNVTIVYRDGVTGTSQRINIDELVAQMDSATAPLLIDLTAFYADEQVELAGDIRGIAGLLKGDSVELDMRVSALGATLAIEGSVEKPLEFDGFEIAVNAFGNSDSLRRLSEFAGSPVAGLGEFSIAATVSGNAELLNVTGLVVSIADMKIDGDLQADFAGDLVRLEATLRSPRIDLTRLMPADDAVESSPAAGTGKFANEPNDRVFPDDPLPLDAFDALDSIVANVNLAIDELIVDSDLVVTNLDVGIHAAPNTISITPLKLKVMGAAVDGRVGLEAVRETAAVTVTLNIRHPSVGDIVMDDNGTMLAGGPLDLDIDVTGSGASIRNIMATLNGAATAEIGTARVSNPWLQRAYVEAVAIVKKQAPKSGRTEPIELHCVVTDFSVRDGIAEADSFVVDIRNFALFGNGQIDLRNESLGLNFDWLAVGIDTRNALPSFEVRGTLASPTGRFDTRELIGSALGLGTGSMTDSDFESSGMTAESGPQRCRQRLVVYKQFRESQAQPKEVTVESVIQDVETTRDALKKLGGFFKKKKRN